MVSIEPLVFKLNFNLSSSFFILFIFYLLLFFGMLQYVLIIVDDYSRATWTFLLNDKTRVLRTLQDFISMVQNQFQKPIKIVRSDNGSEFTCDSCEDLFMKK